MLFFFCKPSLYTSQTEARASERPKSAIRLLFLYFMMLKISLHLMIRAKYAV